ncbi:PNLIP family protein [Megaselia abdita]
MYLQMANSTGALMLQTMLYLANHSTNSIYDLPAQKIDPNEVKCYGVYGCFPINGIWLSGIRQVNVHPQSPAQINPKYYIFNSKNNFEKTTSIDINDVDSFSFLGINPYGKLFVITHGFLEGFNPWIKDMAKTLLESEPDRTATVIVLDWNEGSNPPYVQAAANTRIVGAITAHLLHTLAEEVGMPNLDHVHLIGHSLGAHTCGYTGFYLQRDFNEKIGRITGMDPASPLFTGTSHEVRLDRSDAKFVDVIHTDANPYTGGGLGMVPRVGHVDFYPNGGYDNPGCDRHLQEYLSKKQKTLIDNLQEWFGCNHVRSHRYLTESIKNRNGFKAVTCSSYEEYRQGRCVVCGENKHQCLRMGLSSYEDYKRLVKKRVIKDGDAMVAYLLTGDEAPFAREHFKITVKVSNSEESEDHGGEVGTLTIDLTTRGKKSTGMMKFSDNAL